LLAGGVLAVVPVKCNSIFDKSHPPPADDGYEYVNVLGSQVPLRVKKGQAAVGASAVEVYGPETYRNMTEKAMQTGKAGGP